MADKDAHLLVERDTHALAVKLAKEDGRTIKALIRVALKAYQKNMQND